MGFPLPFIVQGEKLLTLVAVDDLRHDISLGNCFIREGLPLDIA
jgi:hypothetical protein